MFDCLIILICNIRNDMKTTVQSYCIYSWTLMTVYELINMFVRRVTHEIYEYQSHRMTISHYIICSSYRDFRYILIQNCHLQILFSEKKIGHQTLRKPVSQKHEHLIHALCILIWKSYIIGCIYLRAICFLSSLSNLFSNYLKKSKLLMSCLRSISMFVFIDQ